MKMDEKILHETETQINLKVTMKMVIRTMGVIPWMIIVCAALIYAILLIDTAVFLPLSYMRTAILLFGIILFLPLFSLWIAYSIIWNFRIKKRYIEHKIYKNNLIIGEKEIELSRINRKSVEYQFYEDYLVIGTMRENKINYTTIKQFLETKKYFYLKDSYKNIIIIDKKNATKELVLFLRRIKNKVNYELFQSILIDEGERYKTEFQLLRNDLEKHIKAFSKPSKAEKIVVCLVLFIVASIQIFLLVTSDNLSTLRLFFSALSILMLLGWWYFLTYFQSTLSAKISLKRDPALHKRVYKYKFYENYLLVMFEKEGEEVIMKRNYTRFTEIVETETHFYLLEKRRKSGFKVHATPPLYIRKEKCSRDLIHFLQRLKRNI